MLDVMGVPGIWNDCRQRCQESQPRVHLAQEDGPAVGGDGPLVEADANRSRFDEREIELWCSRFHGAARFLSLNCLHSQIRGERSVPLRLSLSLRQLKSVDALATPCSSPSEEIGARANNPG